MADSTNLATYLEDHLAGARFAVSLLGDLAELPDQELAAFAHAFRTDVEADREVLQELLESLGEKGSLPKEAAAWVSQKAARLKISLREPFGQFEAIEVLSLGVLGKRALWKALLEMKPSEPRLRQLPLENLIARASEQFARLEAWRLRLAQRAFARRPRE